MLSRLSALGDTVCSLPAATCLKNAFPDCEITWIVDPRFASIVKCCTAIDHVVEYRFKPFKPVYFADSFDAALDLQGLLKSAWPILRAKAAVKVGYHWQREGSRFVTGRILPDPSSYHVVDQYVDVARAIGGHADRATFALAAKTDALESCAEKLRALNIGSRFAVLNPSAGWVTKRWPPERFSELIDLLGAEGIDSVLIGGPGPADRATSREVSDRANSRVGDLTGETSIGELIALIQMSSLHVGGDTGSSHLAAALNRPAVGLYSITKPERSCPYGWRDSCLFEERGLAHIAAATVFETALRAMASPR